MMQKQHLSSTQFEKLSQGTLTQQQMLECADHIADCSLCARQLADVLSDNLSEPPRGFTDRVLRLIVEPSAGKMREYRRFCMKVAAFVALIISGTLSLLLLPNEYQDKLSTLEWQTDKGGGSLFDEPEQHDSLLSRVSGWIDGINKQQ